MVLMTYQNLHPQIKHLLRIFPMLDIITFWRLLTANIQNHISHDFQMLKNRTTLLKYIDILFSLLAIKELISEKSQ